MSSKEQSELGPTPYHQVARFPGEKPAGRAYNRAQEAIFNAEGRDLSAYRFQLSRIWHVAAGGCPTGYMRSKIAAMPWPPPMHIVTRA